MSLKLYSFAQSSCSWRVRICLALKELDYNHISVNLLKREQDLSEFRKLSPLGQVPALIDGDMCITQSVAIMEYLNDEYTSNGLPLLPDDARSRAKVREITELISSGIQPLQNLSTLRKVGSLRKREWAQFWITTGFEALESSLSRTSGKYSVGDCISMADACLVPQCRNATERYRLDLSKYSNICRINSTLLEHSAFVASSPEVIKSQE